MSLGLTLLDLLLVEESVQLAAHIRAQRYQEHGGRQPLIEFPRQALHAEVLGLEHPDKPGQRVSWTAALPKDMSQLEDELRHRAKTERAR